MCGAAMRFWQRAMALGARASNNRRCGIAAGIAAGIVGRLHAKEATQALLFQRTKRTKAQQE